MSLRTLVVALVLGALCAGCAPTERYYTNKTPEPATTPATRGLVGCGMATPVTRLQSRSSNQRSVEGLGSFPCAPTRTGEAR